MLNTKEYEYDGSTVENMSRQQLEQAVCALIDQMAYAEEHLAIVGNTLVKVREVLGITEFGEGKPDVWLPSVKCLIPYAEHPANPS